MIAVRWAVFALVTFATIAALATTAPDLPPSTLRVVVAAVVGLLAPLFWPGIGASPPHTVRRLVAWSFAASGVAAITLGVFGNPVQPVAKILETCAMLLPIVLLTHALAAVLEGHWRRAALAPEPAREMAGRAVALLLALLGGLPLWLGPLGETLSPAYPGAVDALVAASPLTHLAVASGNDLLRNPWLYQHSNLAALPVSYPGLAELAWSYGAACVLMAGAALAWVRRAGAAPPPFHPENTP